MPRWLPLVVVVAAIVLFGAWTAQGIFANPGFTFLLPRGGAEWIRTPSETTLKAVRRAPHTGTFAVQIHLEQPLAGAVLSVAGMRSVRVLLDGSMLHEEPERVDAWKFERRVAVPWTLSEGEHVLLIACTNDMGPPMIRVRWLEAGVYSGPRWFRPEPNGTRMPITGSSGFDAVPFALTVPSTTEAFMSLLPLIGSAAFVGGFAAWVLLRSRNLAVRADAVLSPARVRWIAMLALAGLGIHNMMQIPLGVGTDPADHYEYMRYIADHHALPPLTLNGQAFQGPLFYALAAIVHEIALRFTDEAGAYHSVRMLTILCGLGLVEIGYRLARRVFQDNFGAQCVAIVVCASIPVVIAKTQVASNEPLAAVLIAAAALGVLNIVSDPPDAISLMRVAAAGVLWGLATLAKVSALVIAGPIALAAAWWIFAWPGPRRRKIFILSAYFIAFTATCGWYFVRSQYLYGKPIIGGWDPLMGFEWWQFPGYRTLDQYTSFGVGLVRPLYALVHGLWDGLYAGLWFDAENSGILRMEMGPTWGYPYALAAVLWAVAPTVALAAGAWRALAGRDTTVGGAQPVLVFTLLIVGAFLAAILGHSLTLPYYNAIKTTYALGAMPFVAVLIAAGTRPLLRTRSGSIAVCAWLAVWLVLVFAGYWAREPIPLPRV